MIDKLEKIFDALASDVRRKILAYLAKTSLNASDIADRFNMARPAISRHLKVLENAGLVKSVKKRQYIL